MENWTERAVNALELIASELEQLRLLREYELGAHIEHSPDPYVRPDDATEE